MSREMIDDVYQWQRCSRCQQKVPGYWRRAISAFGGHEWFEEYKGPEHERSCPFWRITRPSLDE